jgi:FG-GAP-like repeat
VKKVAVVLVLLAAVACSSSPSQSKPAAPPPVVNPTPTPGTLSRIDPTVVEETDTYVIRALPKNEYKKVGDNLIKHPLLTKPVEYFKEDDKYYYVYFPKSLPEEVAAAAGRQAAPVPTPLGPGMAVSAKGISPGVSRDDFTDIAPPRVSGTMRLEKAANPGLPVDGMWRASFVVADVNGDGIPDIVAPPSRVGNGQLNVWIGDGHGSFSPWPMTFTGPDGKPVSNFSIDYGAVAVGDIDGDGHMDIVSASHSGGLVSLFGDGKGTFRVVRTGLPGRDFSSQAITLIDANGDGKLDIVASKDVPSGETMNTIDKLQVRLYLYKGDQGWEWRKQALVGGFYSNSLHGWDYLGDGHKAVLSGSNYTGALSLVWRNAGDGTFAPVQFDGIELYAYHFTTQPGTFGKARVPAFADAYFSQANLPDPTRAVGISVYAFDHGTWTRHRAWRKLESKASVTAMAFGDLDGDGLDDIVFADNEQRKIRVLFQQPDGSFKEMDEKLEPSIASLGQWICLADLDGDGRLDIVLSRTVSSSAPNEKGGIDVYLNKAK